MTEISFGQWLKQWRRQQGIPQKELANNLMISKGHLQKIESGQRRPSTELLNYWASNLGSFGVDILPDRYRSFVAWGRGYGPPLEELLTPNKPAQGEPLRIFLCHASPDKPKVRELYFRLRSDGMKPWLDEEDLLPGQDWQEEIPKAVRKADVVLVCLSQKSITKTGYVQKEIKIALDVADEQPQGTIFLIPAKLEECETPNRLRRWQWVNLFDSGGYERLIRSLRERAKMSG